jgi:protein tyrosine phosphatase (PTP) superfamily phosphohydrolase (DUF442 family)
MRRIHIRILILVALLGVTVTLTMAAAAEAVTMTNRPDNWACKITVSGLPNFFQVTSNLYRGAQPSPEGMSRLETLGVRCVVNLRMLRSDQGVLRHTHLKSCTLAMVPWHVNPREVVKFLKTATDTNNLPLFVHCEHGADRTGFMCAMYRVVVCDWSKEDAIAEMKGGGFHFNPAWKSLVAYIRKADVPALKREIGLPVPETVAHL